MNQRLLIPLLLLLLSAAPATGPTIAWQGWSDDLWAQAKREHKFILLDLGTQWCHWCHVMEQVTYADPDVADLIRQKFIPVRVDADARPDLSNRYEDYGWPATVVFNADGGEIVKRRGYLTPPEMASMLRAIIADPTPGPSVQPAKDVRYTDQNALTQDERGTLSGRLLQGYDSLDGSWGREQKFLDWDCVELCLRQATRGDAEAKRMARQTLTAQLNLLDPAWGGVYQYSTDGDWQHPHFEKIMQMQAENLRIYALAFAQWHDPVDLKTAQSIHRFLLTFLRAPDGAFYTSQDADLVDGVHSADYFKLDDAQRRAQGVPRVDTHQYSRENGWAIAALAALYEASGDATALDHATSAANWIIQNRMLGDGGFSHDRNDSAGPYLADTLAMGQAFLELYTATADRAWLSRAQRCADFIQAHFVKERSAGILTADAHVHQSFAPAPEFDENVAAVRWFNLLAHYGGRASDRTAAELAMRYLATPEVALARQSSVGGLLLADDEITSEPLHVAVVGSKTDPAASVLFHAALAIPTSYKRIEWADLADAPLPNADVTYPNLGKPAAFFCTGAACSAPAFTTAELAQRLVRANAR
jgi:uncharacterized protein YyaL (SSP411 family)